MVEREGSLFLCCRRSVEERDALSILASTSPRDDLALEAEQVSRNGNPVGLDERLGRLEPEELLNVGAHELVGRLGVERVRVEQSPAGFEPGISGLPGLGDPQTDRLRTRKERWSDRLQKGTCKQRRGATHDACLYEDVNGRLGRQGKSGVGSSLVPAAREGSSGDQDTNVGSRDVVNDLRGKRGRIESVRAI
jgi:hypothetical protein